MSRHSTAVNARSATYDIDPVYLNRWSSRSFLEKEVPEDVLFSLFEAARWAPSAYNSQPWRFIIARTKEERQRFYTFVNDFNRKWCEKAPVLALIISKTVRETGENRSHAFDTGAAWGFLALEAVRKGLVTHPMTGIDFEKARKTLNIPDEYAIQALIAIGYRGPKDSLPPELQTREQPSQRHPLEEFIFEGTFGQKLAGK